MKGKLSQFPSSLQLAILLALFVVLNLVYSLVLIGVFPLISGGISYENINNLQASNTQAISALKVGQMFYTLFAYFLPALLFAYWASHEKIGAYLKINKTPNISQSAIAIGIMLFALPLVGALAVWNQGWQLPESLMKVEDQAEQLTKTILATDNIGGLLFNLIVIAVVPAISEEFLFRGAMQNICHKWFKNGWVAVIFTGAVFSAIHFQFMGFMPRFFLGVLLGAIYLVSNNLWLSIIGHFINNALGVITAYLINIGQVSKEMENDELLPWYMLLASALIVMGLFLLLKHQGRNGNNNRQDEGVISIS